MESVCNQIPDFKTLSHLEGIKRKTVMQKKSTLYFKKTAVFINKGQHLTMGRSVCFSLGVRHISRTSGVQCGLITLSHNAPATEGTGISTHNGRSWHVSNNSCRMVDCRVVSVSVLTLCITMNTHTHREKNHTELDVIFFSLLKVFTNKTDKGHDPCFQQDTFVYS